MLTNVRQERTQIQSTLEEIYILNIKYELSPDVDLKVQLDAILEKGIDDANKNLNKYNRLLETIKKQSLFSSDDGVTTYMAQIVPS